MRSDSIIIKTMSRAKIKKQYTQAETTNRSHFQELQKMPFTTRVSLISPIFRRSRCISHQNSPITKKKSVSTQRSLTEKVSAVGKQFKITERSTETQKVNQSESGQNTKQSKLIDQSLALLRDTIVLRMEKQPLIKGAFLNKVLNDYERVVGNGQIERRKRRNRLHGRMVLIKEVDNEYLGNRNKNKRESLNKILVGKHYMSKTCEIIGNKTSYTIKSRIRNQSLGREQKVQTSTHYKSKIQNAQCRLNENLTINDKLKLFKKEIDSIRNGRMEQDYALHQTGLMNVKPCKLDDWDRKGEQLKETKEIHQEQRYRKIKNEGKMEKNGKINKIKFKGKINQVHKNEQKQLDIIVDGWDHVGVEDHYEED